jgi:hypothetical protein
MYIRHFGANEKKRSAFAYDIRGICVRVCVCVCMFVHAYMCMCMSVGKYVRMCVCIYMCVMYFCHCWRRHCDFYWTQTRIANNAQCKDIFTLLLSQG